MILCKHQEFLTKDNARFIIESVHKSDRVILAWGNHGTWQQQDLYTLQLLENQNHLYSLGITKQGCPRHPLYLRSTIKPQIYERYCNFVMIYPPEVEKLDAIAAIEKY